MFKFTINENSSIEKNIQSWTDCHSVTAIGKSNLKLQLLQYNLGFRIIIQTERYNVFFK